jgi:hypothetical protein
MVVVPFCVHRFVVKVVVNSDVFPIVVNVSQQEVLQFVDSLTHRRIGRHPSKKRVD